MDKERRDQHKAKWLHNRKLISQIPETHPDWIVTIAFYAALHCFEVLCAHDDNDAHTGHDVRHDTLKRTPRYKHIWKHYLPLSSASMVARYDYGHGKWVPLEMAKSQFVRHHLRQIEISVCSLAKIEAPEELFAAISPT